MHAQDGTAVPQITRRDMQEDLPLVMAKEFAEQVKANPGNLAQKVDAAFELALSRKPTPVESASLHVYADRHGLANTCRVIYNLNEFVFID